MRKLNINEHYAELLKGKDLSIPTEKSWKLIKNRNKGREEKIAFSEDDRKITYGEMYEDWEEAARVFSALGITRNNNSRVLTIMPNVAKTGTFDYSADMTGAVIDFIDPTTPKEKVMKYIEGEKITDIIASDLLYVQRLFGTSGQLKNKLGIRNIVLYQDAYLTSLMPSRIQRASKTFGMISKINPSIIRYQDAVKNSMYTQISYDSESSAALSLITHTSGTTTGMGKPIPITDINRNALVKNYELAQFGYEPGMSMMHFIPYFAGYGVVNTTHLGLSQGLELQQLPLFSPNAFGDCLEKYKSNIALATPACWLNLINNPKHANIDLSFLVFASSGGGPLTEHQEEKINEFLLKHGSKVILTKGYGLSEMCGCCIVTVNGYNSLGSVGVRHPLVDVKIIDDQDGHVLSDNASGTGEVYINAATMCQEALDGTAIISTKVIDGKKYLKTKDILHRNEFGEFSYVERKDRMFNRYDGYNVYPQSVERVFLDYPEINDVLMTKKYDDECNGNVPKVYIELADKGVDRESLIRRIINNSFLSNKMGHTEYVANFREIPREFIFLDAIPKNTMGKNSESLIDCEAEAKGEAYAVNVEENNMKVLGYSIIKHAPALQKVKK